MIVDYGMANLRSVQKAFERQGHPAEIVSRPEQVRHADRLVVPGVGAFADAMRILKETHLGEAIIEHAHAGKPLLGICLGLQLLMDVSFEDGEHRGLGLIPGDCVRLAVDQPPHNLKVPHMGWNSLAWPRNVPLCQGLTPGCYVYFVHSYHVRPADPRTVAMTADYGGPVVAAIWKDNIVATQFHPEKSQAVGGHMLANFARM
jgi:glutamine amidotransferase